MTRKPDDPPALATIDLDQLDTVTGGRGTGYSYGQGQQQQQQHHKKHKKHKKHKHQNQGGWSFGGNPGSDPYGGGPPPDDGNGGSGGGWDGGW